MGLDQDWWAAIKSGGVDKEWWVSIRIGGSRSGLVDPDYGKKFASRQMPMTVNFVIQVLLTHFFSFISLFVA